MPPTARRPYRWAVLALRAVAVSTASVFIRLTPAPPLVLGTWRVMFAAILLTPWGAPRLAKEWHGLTRRHLLLLGLASLALALHFAAWISSLRMTSVASSVVLVSTSPIYVGLASHFILRQSMTGRRIVAILGVILGSIAVGFSDMRLSGQALAGDLLALVGALMSCAYILLGRSVRHKLSTLAYVWPYYGVAGLLLVLACLATGQPLFGYSPRVYALFVAIAVIPQILGHSAFNWALGHFSPVFITLALFTEPIGASLLAWLILDEAPSAAFYLGGALILAGIYLASREERPVA